MEDGVETIGSLDLLQKRLDYTFGDLELLQEALTHRSWLNEQVPRGGVRSGRDQQRLEFLGDAFLGYSVARWFFVREPDAEEGRLTRLRKSVVEHAWLNEVGKALELSRWIRLGTGERTRKGHNGRLLEDTLEAIIGAVLLDGGEGEAHALIGRLLERFAAVPKIERDPVSAFNHWYQEHYRDSPPKPSYVKEGNGHQPVWIARLALLESADVEEDEGQVVKDGGQVVEDGGQVVKGKAQWVEGRGRSKKAALRAACKKVLEALKED